MIIPRQSFIKMYISRQRRLFSSTTRIKPIQNLPTGAYKPAIVEKDKYEKWEKKGVFKAENSIKEPSFRMVLPPPNVTGNLHLGHALACTIQDVIVRRKRSMGQNVLWLPGTDHAGIATQGVVEKYLKTQNTDRNEIGREKFNDEVWKWKEKHGNTICDQLKTLGCSLDWSRQIFTMDSRHTHAVNTAFIELFNKRLIYRRKGLVNWCSALKSTVSDIEVDSLPIDGQTSLKVQGYDRPVVFGQLFSFAYKIHGSGEELVVCTTMPETMLGDTAIAVHPDDERYKHLVNTRAVHPFTNKTIPIIFDKFVDMQFGTGAVKITPAHSKVDFEVAKQHNLPLLQVINEDGRMKNTDQFNNMKRYDCREILVKKIEELGLLKEVKPHKMNLPICSRTGDVITHLPKEQWFLSCKELNKKAEAVVRNGELKIEPEKFVKTWLHWTGDERDWCISRQLWWGHQIPAYKCSVGKDIVWIAAPDDITAKIEASKYLRTLPKDIETERDTDVLDTWFSSGIYPFAALGWPDKNSTDYKDFYPLSLMATGHDILGFWVHRMVMLGLELTDKLPFNNVLFHGIICDNKGAKMSKSKGNVIDPIDVINGITIDGLKKKSVEMLKNGVLSKEELNKAVAYHKSNYSNTNGIPECGVDALRFTLLSQDVKSHYVTFDVNMCHANKLFCNKIWQSIKYMQLSFDKLRAIEDEITPKDLGYFDKWILSRLAHMVDKVNKSMDDYDFHLATKAIKTHIYHEFCDVYLEATKPGFSNDNMKVGFAHAHALSAALNTSLRCLHPFMIYVTHELIPKIPALENNIIHNFKDSTEDHFEFPNNNDFKALKNNDIENKVGRVLNTMNLVRELKGFYGLSNKLRPRIIVKSTDDGLIKDLSENKTVVLNLTRCSDLEFDDRGDTTYVKALLDKNTEINVEIRGDDIENSILAVRHKLQNKIKKMEELLDKLEMKLSSSAYLSSAQESTQKLDREKLESKKEELRQLQRLV